MFLPASPRLGDAKIWTWDYNTRSLAGNPLSYYISQRWATTSKKCLYNNVF